jgi:5-(carboxyamino)imidazole ribonucleotide synthase
MFNDLKIGILSAGQRNDKLISYITQTSADISFMSAQNASPFAKHEHLFCYRNPLNYQDVIVYGKELDVLSIKCDEVDMQALYDLKEMGIKIYPLPETIEIIQHKSTLKQILKENHIPQAIQWLVMDSESQAAETDNLSNQANHTIEGKPHQAVLKIHTSEKLYASFHQPAELSDIVDVVQEVSVIVSRNESGMIECHHPLGMTYEKERMLLDFETMDANLTKETGVKICTIAIQVAEALDLIGMIRIDMIIAGNGKIYVDDVSLKTLCHEIHTSDKKNYSPLEQQIREILNLPIPEHKAHTNASLHGILEPAAYRKHCIEETLKTILCTNDMHLYWNDRRTKQDSKQKSSLPICDTQREEFLAKAILITHILRDDRG